MKAISILTKILAAVVMLGCYTQHAFAANAMRIVINNHLGAPEMLIDENRHVVWQAEYDEFGKATILVEEVEFNHRLPGQYYDKETGLHYNYNRDYDPSLGRYVQSDPIGLAGGINTYGYAGGNPVSYVDPLGLAFGSNTATGASSLLNILLGVGGGSNTNSSNNAGSSGSLDPTSLSNPWPGSGSSASEKSDKQAQAAATAGNPPGNCTPEEHRSLQNDVDLYCKYNGEQGCSIADSCPTLEAKLNMNVACAEARDKINNRCFSGGDAGHLKAAKDNWNAVKNCTTALSLNNCSNCP